jgi:hypothetical protein
MAEAFPSHLQEVFSLHENMCCRPRIPEAGMAFKADALDATLKTIHDQRDR